MASKVAAIARKARIKKRAGPSGDLREGSSWILVATDNKGVGSTPVGVHPPPGSNTGGGEGPFQAPSPRGIEFRPVAIWLLVQGGSRAGPCIPIDGDG